MHACKHAQASRCANFTAHMFDVGHHQAVAGGHGNTNVVAVMLQQRPAALLEAGVECRELAQADAEGLDDKRQVGELGACEGRAATGQTDPTC